MEKNLQKQIDNHRSYRIVANAIDTISVECAGNSEKIIDLLTGYLFDKEESKVLKNYLNKNDFSKGQMDILMIYHRNKSEGNNNE